MAEDIQQQGWLQGGEARLVSLSVVAPQAPQAAPVPRSRCQDDKAEPSSPEQAQHPAAPIINGTASTSLPGHE